MPHAQAFIPSSDPAALAAGLVRRLAHEFETEWSAHAGFLRLNEGTCTFHAWPEGLRLDAFADSGERLARVEQFVTHELARDAGPQVDWRRRPLS